VPLFTDKHIRRANEKSEQWQRHKMQNVLDTLAQVPPGKEKPPGTGIGPAAGTDEKPFKRCKNDLSKRARDKWFSRGLVISLVDIWETPLKKSYWNTYHCATTLTQNGKKLTSRYCNNRWCMVCNRIRTGKLINGYLPQIKAMKEKYFLTLTIPNVWHQELRPAIKEMQRAIVLINRNIREKKKMNFQGIRKLECTYNATRNDYHPHFHLIVDSYAVAQEIRLQWLKRFPDAREWSQDITQASDTSAMELFKYFTKIISKPTAGGGRRIIYARALDTIFQAMQGMRVYQPLGIRKISEDVDPDQAQIFDLDEDNAAWTWNASNDEHERHGGSDWINKETGEMLTNYTPSDALQNIQIHTGEVETFVIDKHEKPPGPKVVETLILEPRKHERKRTTRPGRLEFYQRN
jgi:hypothetical protein